MSSFPMRAELAAGALLLALGPAAPALRAQGLPAEDVALLLSAQQGGSLALESAAVVWRVEGARAELRLSLELPVAGLAGAEAERVELRWAVYVVDGVGAVIASRFHTMTAERRRLEASGSAGVRILESLEVPAAPVSVRTLVRELGSSRFGLRVLAVDAAVLRPFVARRRGGWIELGADASRVQPAALAAVPAGGELDLMVPAGADYGRTGWMLRPQGTEGASGDLPLTVTPAPPAPSVDGGWRRWRLSAPEGVEGRHRVLRRGDPEAGGAAVYILPAESGGPVAWPRAIEASSSPLPEPRRPVPAGRGRVRDLDMRRRLLDGLAAVAAGGAGPATDALLDVLDEAWAAAGTDGVMTVIDEALDLAAAVVRAAPESLPALLAALVGLYDQCVERMHQPCSDGLRILLPALLRAAEEIAPGEAASMADAWAILGWRAMERQALGQAVEQLRQAARLAPERTEPRVAVAKIYEIGGDYRQAAQVLEELLEIHPGLPEPRLRLGVQYRRLGRRRAALATLGAAAAEGPAWIRIVASQELAVLHREREDVERAEETLRQAIAQFPDDEQLTLQLAALLDASGRSEASGALLDGLSEPGGAGRTPRNRYSRWPPSDLEGARTRLRRAGMERRQALASALRDGVR